MTEKFKIYITAKVNHDLRKSLNIYKIIKNEETQKIFHQLPQTSVSICYQTRFCKIFLNCQTHPKTIKQIAKDLPLAANIPQKSLEYYYYYYYGNN
jgi:hypothetical protein